MVEALFASGGLTGLVNNAAGNFISPTEALSPRGFDAIAGIVFHGSFYVTQAIGKRWVAQAKAGEWKAGQPCRSVMSIITTWVDNGSALRGAVGDEQGRHRHHEQVAGGGMGQVRHPPEHRGPGRDPDRRHEQAPQPGRAAGPAQHRATTRWRGPG